MSFTLSLSGKGEELVDTTKLEQLTQSYNQAFPEVEVQVEVLFVDMAEIQTLNKKHRNIDEPTDVLSFPLFANLTEIKSQSEETLIGSIVICPEKADIYHETLIQLVHHGLLHLLGFDHEERLGEWQTEEKRILEIAQTHQLSIPSLIV